MPTPRLTANQVALLEGLIEKGGLYIRRNSQPARTVAVLARAGLAHETEHDGSPFGQDRWEPTDRGRDLLAPTRVDGKVLTVEQRRSGTGWMTLVTVAVPGDDPLIWLLDRDATVTVRRS